MDYKKEIIEMVKKIAKKENIEMLYGATKTMLEYEEKGEEQGS